MARFIYIAGVDQAAAVRFPDGYTIASAAEQGAVSLGTIEIDDPSGTFDLKPLTAAYIVESDASPTRLWTGFLFNLTIIRGPHRNGAGRVWQADCVDVNWMLTQRVVLSADGKRPAETDTARLTWLLANPAMSGLVASGSLTDLTDPRNLDEADYRYQTPMAVLADIAPQSGKVAWAFYNASVELFYDTQGATTNDSAAKISNVYTDAASGVYHPYIDATMERAGENIASKVVLRWVGGVTTQENLTTKSTYGEMTYMWDSSRIGRSGTAATQAATVLANKAAPEETVTCTLLLPAANVNDIREGQRIQCKFSHLPGLTSYTSMRVIRRAVAVDDSDQYLVKLTLSNKVRDALGGGGSGAFPLAPATTPVYNQSAVGTTTTALTSTSTATLPAAPVSGDVVVGLAMGKGTATFTWPSGWTEIEDSSVTGDWSLAYSTTHTTAAVTVTSSAALDNFVLGVVSVRGGAYETYTVRVQGGSPGSTAPPLPDITPVAGNAAVIIAFAALYNAYTLVTSPAGYTLRENAESNSGPASTRINAWTRAVDPTSGTYSGTPTYSDLLQGVLYQVVVSGGAASSPPEPAQTVPWAVVTMAGAVGTTLYPYATGSLLLKVQGVLISRASYTETDPAAGTFTLSWTPDTDEVVTVSYSGR